MNLKTRKKIISTEANKLFNKYKTKGLISIYWYGSGLNNKDFNKNSDIDLIAISKDNLQMKYEKEMISTLKQYEKLDIRIRIMYLSELNNKKIKSNIAKFLSIKLWLIDFNNYIHISGKKFTEKNFKLKKANPKEAVSIEEKIHLRTLKEFSKNPAQGIYLVKSALYYFYYLSCQKNGYFIFSYNNLSKKVQNNHKKIVKKLIEIKNNNYPIDKIKNILPKLNKLKHIT